MALEHHMTSLPGVKDRRQRALQGFILESCFTLLNRLAALKLMEHRGLVIECLSDGIESEGARLFRQVAPATSHDIEGSYRTFLELLFDDISNDVRLLFDRSMPASFLFPKGGALKSVLEILNDSAIKPVWDEDEALGWIYQYFTPKDLREKVRKESSAPRNSYELAIRNQFYTPEYVVRFLVENTLGRLWWEMNPDTSLQSRDYLVYRANESPPLRTPKDPRQIRILDPACGSGHFLHYCYDLLQIIYREAYDGHAAGEDLRKEYSSIKDLEHALPSLILSENLYGIDIDLRACQLTALSLYLRAKRENPEADITRVNAAHATAMPGEESVFEEFLGRFSNGPRASIIKGILKGIWEEVGDLVSEAGSLLRPETGLHKCIEDIRNKYEDNKTGQLMLQEMLGPEYEQGELPIDVIHTEEFWRGLEPEVLKALEEYAEEQTRESVIRRLFAEDAAHGFAFLDTLMRSYDVILMNPPFGSASKPSKKYIDSNYPRTKNDVYAAFVERGLELLYPGGYLGAITSRTGFFLTSFQKWREEILLTDTDIIAFADLGQGVLDTAMVETAAYILRKK
ncbi:Eco57I restriction-modification methylase domain-containing protein [Gemmatimonadota bacterium]